MTLRIRTWIILAIASSAGGFFLSGCGSLSDKVLVRESAEGTVYLERLVTRGATARYSGPLKSFHASHPIVIAPEVIARILAGLQIEPASASPGPRTTGPVPIFSEQQTDFLAPSLARALAQAEPAQRVRFRVESGAAVTDGTIFVMRPVLHFTLLRYRSRPDLPDADLPLHKLVFLPEVALVREEPPQSWLVIEPDRPRLAVNYEQLAQLPVALTAAPPDHQAATGVARAQPDASAQDLQTMKDLIVKQAQELQALKTEVESLRRQLGEKEAGIQKLKPNKQPVPPAQEGTP